MQDEWIAKLAAIGGALNAPVKSPDADIRYDLLGGAIFWSDERPKVPLEEADCLKLVLRYRTTLIEGNPDPNFRVYWDAAQELFPNWPGFSPERCRENEQLAEFGRKSSDQGILSIKLSHIVCRLEQEFSAPVSFKAIEKRMDRTDPPDITVRELHDIVCRCVRLSGRMVSDDAWQRVRRCVAEGMGVETGLVDEESRLARDFADRCSHRAPH